MHEHVGRASVDGEEDLGAAGNIGLSRADLLDALAGGAVVVTGNARLSRSLLTAYERRMLAEGRGAWATPAVMPLPAWLVNRYSEAALYSAAPLPILSAAPA